MSNLLDSIVAQREICRDENTGVNATPCRTITGVKFRRMLLSRRRELRSKLRPTLLTFSGIRAVRGAPSNFLFSTVPLVRKT